MTAPRNAIACPHWLSRMRTIAFRQLSPLAREIYLDCMHVDGCHRCVAQLGIVRTLVPGLMPNAQVSLPIVERRASGLPDKAPAAPPFNVAGPHYAPMVLKTERILMDLSRALPHDQMHAAMLIHRATRFILAHQAQHLDSELLIRHCCAHLKVTAGITESAAEHYTMHALADLQAKHVPAYFDITHSTSSVIRVVDPATGDTYAMTAPDVLQVAKMQSKTGRDATCIH